jgi:hypothetical protein
LASEIVAPEISAEPALMVNPALTKASCLVTAVLPATKDVSVEFIKTLPTPSWNLTPD